MSFRNLMRFIAQPQFIFQIFVLLCLISTANAKPYFQDCKTAFSDPSFHLLKEYWDINEKVTEPEDPNNPADIPQQCLRINDSEYIVTIQSTAMYNEGSVLFCNFNIHQNCKQYPYMKPLLGVAAEFQGEKKQFFTLLSSYFLSNGISEKSDSVLFFTPESKSFPFKIQQLVEIDGAEDGAPCGMSDDKFKELRAIKFQTPEYHIEHAGQSNMTLVFDLMKQDCKTRKIINYQERYVFRHDHFIKVS